MFTRWLAVFIASCGLTCMFIAGPGNAETSQTQTSPPQSPEVTTVTSPSVAASDESTQPQPVPQPEPPAPQPQPELQPVPSDRQLGAGPAAQRPQLEVTAEFDKRSYRTGELITVTFRVKNIGSELATGLFVLTESLAPTDLRFDPDQWGGLARPGVTLEPGAAAEAILSGQTRTPDVDRVTLTGNVYDQDGLGIYRFSFTAPVTKTFSHVAGTVFADRNGNAQSDSGEELAGAALTWSYILGGFTVTTTSGAGGRFDFGEIPTVSYSTSGTAAGFVVLLTQVDINANKDNTHLLIRAVPPLNGTLHASMAFTKDTYKPGELAHITVTLSNSGRIPLVGIVAGCNRSGEGPQLSGIGPGWGELAANSDGVTLDPGQTKVIDVSERIPDNAIDHGYVAVACDFGLSDADLADHPSAGDTAAVPGGIANLPGTILTPAGSGLAGVRVVLVRDGACPIIGDITTDGNGKFEFTNLAPAPDYKLYLVPPAGWNFAGDNPHQIRVIANRPGRLTITARRGDAASPAIPSQPATCTTTSTSPTSPSPTSTAPPPPQGSAPPQGGSNIGLAGLAGTGASVLLPSLLGLAAVLLGVGAVIGARLRRRAGGPMDPHSNEPANGGS